MRSVIQPVRAGLARLARLARAGLAMRRPVRQASLGFAMATLLTACSGSPSIGVLGAYFPDWLFCVAGGTALTAIVHVLSYRHGYGGWLTPPALVYPALAALFSIVLWAVGFNL